jgi:hypothetical protein
MARKIKVDNALLKQFSRKSRKEKSHRDLIAYFLIVCEGEKTDPNYFRAFPKKAGKIVFDVELEGGGISTLKVVEKAIELRNASSQKYDRVWAVFDRDSFKASSFNNAILKAKANGIECAWSNEAFELWYLLHFHNRVTAMGRDDYKKAIELAVNDKIKKGKKHFQYRKNDPDMFTLLSKIGSQDLAIRWAKELSAKIDGEKFANYNPNTQVYKLVEELIGKSKKLNTEIVEKYTKGE